MTRRFVAFMFRNELDMLECQLYEHYDDVDWFVVVEAPVNHQGRPKPLVFAENRDRFTRYAGKIMHVVCEGMPTAEQCADPWVRERLQRDAALPALLRVAEPDDIIINVDVDEIPSADAVKAEPDPIMGMMLRYHPFAVDWQGGPGANGTLMRVWFAQRHGLTALRMTKDVRPPPYPVLADGGWHLSWLGGQAVINDKLDAFCHLEARDAALEANARDDPRASGQCGPLTPGPMKPVDVDETWPRWVYERKCPANWFRPREVAP